MSFKDTKIVISGSCPTSVKEAFYKALEQYEKEEGPLEVCMPSQGDPVSVTFHDLCDLDHLHSLWYGGMCATVSWYDGWEFEIGAYGEVRAELWKISSKINVAELLTQVVDKNNGGEFLSVMRDHIPNDKVLMELRDTDYNGLRLEVHEGNWWACSPTDPSGEVRDDCEWDLDCNLFRAIFNVIWRAEEFLAEEDY